MSCTLLKDKCWMRLEDKLLILMKLKLLKSIKNIQATIKFENSTPCSH